MPLAPNGAPPGYCYQAGATGYIIDPAGAYSLGARRRRRAIRSAHTAARARARRRQPQRASIFPSPGRPSLRRRLPILLAHTAPPARACRRSMRPACTAAPRPSRRRSRTGKPTSQCLGRPLLRRRPSILPAHTAARTLTFRSPQRSPPRRKLSPRPAHTALRARPRQSPTREAPTAPPARAPLRPTRPAHTAVRTH